MKSVLFTLTILFSLQSFAKDACPDIEGDFIAKENDAFLTLEMEGNVLNSANLEQLAGGIILDGQSHVKADGSIYTASCSGKTININMQYPSTKATYTFKAVKRSKNKVVLTEELARDGQKENWKYTLKKM